MAYVTGTINPNPYNNDDYQPTFMSISYNKYYHYDVVSTHKVQSELL